MILEFWRAIASTTLFRPLDIQFAQLLCSDNPALFLLSACLSLSSREGHVCLPLAQLNPAGLFNGLQRKEAEHLWQLANAPTEVDQWQPILSTWPALSLGDSATPVVLSLQRLYLHRFWYDECQLANYFKSAHLQAQQNVTQIRTVLDGLFGEATVDWQKVAAAVALTRRYAVISGGPGSGKTTTVAKLLAALLQLIPQRVRIQMAAPTGKAAARLTESLGKALHSLPITAEIKQRFPTEALTLHRLLGARANSRQLQYHRANPLHLDILIVDEASMVDMTMMARVVTAMPRHARLILLGDRDQLASVEAGAVLGDLFQCSRQGYSELRALELQQLSGCALPPPYAPMPVTVADSLCELKHSYRFDSHSGIGQLAKAVNQGCQTRVTDILARKSQDVQFVPLKTSESWQVMLSEISAGYAEVLQLVRAGDGAEAILSAFSQYQLLCAVREGSYGVSGLNRSIEAELRKSGFLYPASAEQTWYLGRPIMITRNDPVLGLSNGDIGMTLADQAGGLSVWFRHSDGKLQSVHPSRLPSHETSWAMTVHKSQGSEFVHTALVLPLSYSPILTRELLYTAITRARKQLSLYGDPAVILQAVTQRTQRRSGLTERLQSA